jgi:hypothetical protein
MLLPAPATEEIDMDKTLVSCGSCERTWHSQTMADGLRLVGCCPRCGGELTWLQDAAAPRVDAPATGEGAGVAPHLVLGLPRR